MARGTYEAIFNDGSKYRTDSRRHDSDAEAWGSFCVHVWDLAVARGSKTVRMGQSTYKGGTPTIYMHRVVPAPPEGMTRWTMLNAPNVERPVPGPSTDQEG